MRVSLRQNVDNIKKGFAALSGKVAKGEISAFQMLEQMGARAAGYCKEAIETGIAPANEPSRLSGKARQHRILIKGF